MTFSDYFVLMEQLVKNPTPPAPYDQPDYYTYTKLNVARTKRWIQKGVLMDELIEVIQSISRPQHWIIITEPWCGDAAHSVPFIAKMSELNPLITLHIELRDAAPHRIQNYLTNGSQSIPKWIVQDELGMDKWVWGPRPENMQALFLQWKNEGLEFDDIKEQIQQAYNLDAGHTLQQEALSAFKKLFASS